MTPLAASQLPDGGKTPLTASTSQRPNPPTPFGAATPVSQDFRTPLSSRLRRTPSSSQGGVRRNTTTARLFENIIDPDTHITEEEEGEEEEKETLEMSQVVWDTVEASPVETTAPSRRSSSSTTTNLLNASLWGPDEDDADFLKQLEW
jgi:hypothetical protein